MTAASVSDVATSLGRPISDTAEVAQVTQWLGDAEMLIQHRLGDVSALDPDALKYVEREAVVARVRNPDGVSSETVDDYTYRMPTESRRVTILDEWWALLSPTNDQATASIRPSFDADTAFWPVSTPPRAYDGNWGWP